MRFCPLFRAFAAALLVVAFATQVSLVASGADAPRFQLYDRPTGSDTPAFEVYDGPTGADPPPFEVYDGRTIAVRPHWTGRLGYVSTGTIIRAGSHVRGLTSAATLWIVSCVGIAVGAGDYIGAIVVTSVVFVVLTWVKSFEKKFREEV